MQQLAKNLILIKRHLWRKHRMAGKQSILIVDDDKFVRLGLKELLTERGYEVETAEDGFEALKMTGERDFDLILLDLILPGISGPDTLAKILEIKPRSSVIAMTAYSEERAVGNVMASGAKRCFIKPMDIESLENAMREVVLTG
jgi:DNA-binding response OmpR family regulator